MIFSQRVPDSMAAIPGRMHYLSDIEDRRDDVVRKCSECLLVKSISMFRQKTKGAKRWYSGCCRACENKRRSFLRHALDSDDV